MLVPGERAEPTRRPRSQFPSGAAESERTAMPPKPIAMLMMAFLVYLISLSPGEAGQQGNNFVEWSGDVLENVVDFVDGLVSDDSPASSTPPAT